MLGLQTVRYRVGEIIGHCVSVCVFLGTDRVDEGVLSWRLKGEAMAGGRLAHTPQCDQQEKTFNVNIIVQT